MIESNQDLFPESKRGEWIRLRTMIFIRWVAVTGQLAAIIIAFQYFELALDLSLCFFAVGLSGLANIVASLFFPESKRLSELENVFMILFDLFQLAFLLFLTGGLNNPFSFLLVAPVVVSAAALKKKIYNYYRISSRFNCNSTFVFFRTFRNFIWKNSNHPRYFLIWKLGCNQYWNCIFGFLFKSGYVRAKHNERCSICDPSSTI